MAKKHPLDCSHGRRAVMVAAPHCPCAESDPHVIARRSTSDGKHVLLWQDGSLTWALGEAIKGFAFPRTTEQARLALAAGRLVLGEVCLWDAMDVPDLVSAARWAAARHGTPGDLRARMKAVRERRSTDRDGGAL
jgi:hypothetical protein